MKGIMKAQKRPIYLIKNVSAHKFSYGGTLRKTDPWYKRNIGIHSSECLFTFMIERKEYYNIKNGLMAFHFGLFYMAICVYVFYVKKHDTKLVKHRYGISISTGDRGNVLLCWREKMKSFPDLTCLLLYKDWVIDKQGNRHLCAFKRDNYKDYRAQIEKKVEDNARYEYKCWVRLMDGDMSNVIISGQIREVEYRRVIFWHIKQLALKERWFCYNIIYPIGEGEERAMKLKEGESLDDALKRLRTNSGFVSVHRLERIR